MGITIRRHRKADTIASIFSFFAVDIIFRRNERNKGASMTPLLPLLCLCGISAIASPVASQPETKVKRQDDQSVTKLFSIEGMTKMFRVEGKSYVLVLGSKGWNAAKADCEDIGGRLASPITYKEFDRIVTAVKSSRAQGDAQYVWVGASKTGDSITNGWTWITGEPLPAGIPGTPRYGKWIDGEPEPTGSTTTSHFYAFIDTKLTAAKLRTWPEEKQLSFVCQMQYRA